MNVAGVGADSEVEISARPVPQEPLVSTESQFAFHLTDHVPNLQYLLANLGMSENFGYVDLTHLVFPAIMTIDYVRVYQRSDSINIGCDPEDFPTAA